MLAGVAVAAGVAAFVVDDSGLGFAAGVTGVVAAVLATAAQMRERGAREALDTARTSNRRLRRQLDEAFASMAEHDAPMPTLPGSSADPHAAPDERWEPDADSGMLLEHHLPVLLYQTVATARRKVLPVSVVIWELDGLAEATPEARRQALVALGDVAFAALRESDALFRLSDVVALAVLSDTAEPGAVMVAERVRHSLRTSPLGGSITVSAGVACYPSHALDATELVTRAGQALARARLHGHARDHVAVAEPD